MEISQLAVLVIGLVLMVVMVIVANRNWSRYQLIMHTETSRVSSLVGGLSEVRGKVVPMGDTLLSPLSKTTCVHYHLVISESAGSGGSGGASFAEERRSVPCGVDDGTGVIEVDLDRAQLILEWDVKVTSANFDSASSAAEHMLLEQYDISPTHLSGSANSMVYEETVLQEGDEIYVLGDASCLPVRDPALAYIIHKRGLPMVNVSHEGNDGRPGTQVFLAVLFLFMKSHGLFFCGRKTLKLIAELLGNALCLFLVYKLVYGREYAHVHKRFYHHAGAYGDLIRKVLDAYGKTHLHLSYCLCCRPCHDLLSRPDFLSGRLWFFCYGGCLWALLL